MPLSKSVASTHQTFHMVAQIPLLNTKKPVTATGAPEKKKLSFSRTRTENDDLPMTAVTGMAIRTASLTSNSTMSSRKKQSASKEMSHAHPTTLTPHGRALTTSNQSKTN